MKPKVCRDALWPVFLVIEILIAIFILLIDFFAIFVLIVSMKDSSEEKTVLIVFELLWGVGGNTFLIFLFNSPRVLDRAFGRLLIYDDKVVLKCPFRSIKTMTVENCNYVGVEDYNALNRGIPIVRGDETSFVYLSTNRYPRDYRGKISILKNRQGFIKFSYTDELALALLDIFPNEKCYPLKAFYDKMQAQDRMLKKK